MHNIFYLFEINKPSADTYERKYGYLCYSDTPYWAPYPYPIRIGYGYAPDTAPIRIRYATWRILNVTDTALFVWIRADTPPIRPVDHAAVCTPLECGGLP